MPDVVSKLVCGGCGKSFAFKPEYAGRSFRCKCGAVIKAPAAGSPPAAASKPRAVAVAASAPASALQAVAAPPKAVPVPAAAPAGDDDFAKLVAEAEYDLTPPTPPPLPRHTVRAAPVAAVIAAPAPGTRAPSPRSPMLAYAGTVRKPVADEGTEAAKITDLWAPLILIACGLVAYFVDGWFFFRIHNPVGASLFVIIESVINLVLVFIALLIGIKLIDLGLGPIGPALMKIAAVALLPDALGDIIHYTTHIPYAAWIATLFMYWGLLSYLFEMDFGEVVIVTGILWVVQTWVSMLLIAALLGGLGIHLPSAALPSSGSSGGGGSMVAPGPGGDDSEPEQKLDAKTQDSMYGDLVDGGVEARDWCKPENVHHIGGKMNRAALLGWAENFYSAGAKKVWIVHIQKVPPDEFSREFVIELPDDKESRKKIFFFHDNLQHEIEKTTDKGTKYLHITVD